MLLSVTFNICEQWLQPCLLPILFRQLVRSSNCTTCQHSAETIWHDENVGACMPLCTDNRKMRQIDGMKHFSKESRLPVADGWKEDL